MTAGELRNEALTRCDEDPAAPVRYTAKHALDAINEAYRIFAFFTFCLEKTANLTLTANEHWYRILSQFSDFIAVLRIKNGTAYLNPGNLFVFGGGNSNWQQATGSATRYAVLGFDLMAIDKAPASPGSTLAVTYAYSPAAMVVTDTPLLPAEWVPALVDYAVPRLRVRDGGAEFRSAMEHHWPRWTAAVALAARHVRSKALTAGYQRWPMEFAPADQSKMLKAMLGAEKAPGLAEMKR